MSVYYVAGFPVSDELYHHGIKGQKWGVRRYQNPDGTLTPAGKARYGTVENFNNYQQLKKAKKEYGASFNDAYKTRSAALSPFKEHRNLQKSKWEGVHDKITAYEKAKTNYKKSKAEAKNIPEVRARNEKIKKALIIGGSIAGTAALAYGGYKLAQANPELIQYGQYKIKNLFSNKRSDKLSNLTEAWKDHPEDDSINRMAKSSFRNIEKRHGASPSTMSDVMKRGQSNSISEMTRNAIDKSNLDYKERTAKMEQLAKNEQELARERRKILSDQFNETVKILMDEQKSERKSRKKKGK